uniref:Zinc finger LSD1-type domain-containing protein n=1 Tax=Lotus japonicus TaxID=34305 RepID=I3RZC1_LOTJA|nr:unknown [Lotus japonicus]
MEMSQLYCGGCRTLLMYANGATSVRCSCCNTTTRVPESNQVSHIHCGNCGTALMYPHGALSVKCAICQYITNVSRSNGTTESETTTSESEIASSISSSRPHFESQTVVVENPMSVDSNGKLVSNVVVGVATNQR